MKIVEFDEIRRAFQYAELEENLILIENLSDLHKASDGEPAKIDALIVAFCMQGQVSMTVDEVEHRISAGEMFIYFPNQVISDYLMSPDAKSRALFCSTKNINKFVFIGKQVWRSLKYVRENPVIKVNEDEKDLFLAYYNIVLYNRRHPDTRYRKETTDFLLHSFVFHLMTILESHHMIENTEASHIEEDNVPHSSDYLFRRFVLLLSESKGHMRNVNECAQQLNVTPKYLSATVKKVSGRTALDWIHEVMVKQIDQQMRYTSKSIKEIAMELNFSSLSFFTRFFREHFGMSPTEYRKQIRTRP